MPQLVFICTKKKLAICFQEAKSIIALVLFLKKAFANMGCKWWLKASVINFLQAQVYAQDHNQNWYKFFVIIFLKKN